MTFDTEKHIANQIITCEQEISKIFSAIDGLSDPVLRKAKTARYAQFVRHNALLQTLVADPTLGTAEQRAHLQQLFNDANALRWQLALSALPAVKRLARRMQFAGIDYDEAYQEGMIGCLNAATRFDPTRGIRFQTHAKWWARAAITREIDRIRGKSGASSLQVINLHKEINFRMRQGEHPSQQALADYFNISIERVGQLLSMCQPLSLDAPLGSSEHGEDANDDKTLGSMMIDRDAADPIDAITYRQICEMLQAKPLSDDVHSIVVQHFALEGSERKLSDIASEIRITPAGVRQRLYRGIAEIKTRLREPTSVSS